MQFADNISLREKLSLLEIEIVETKKAIVTEWLANEIDGVIEINKANCLKTISSMAVVEQPKPEPTKQEPKVYTSVEPKQFSFRKKTEDNVNLTSQYLLDVRHDRYESFVQILLRGLKTNGKAYKIPEHKQEDQVRNFMVFMIDTDHLRSRLQKGESISSNAVWYHFTQWLTRDKYQKGQDALDRMSGARTQAQVMKKNQTGADPVFQSAEIVTQLKNESGGVVDLYDATKDHITDFDTSIKISQIKEKIHKKLRAEFSEESAFYVKLFEDHSEQTYDSYEDWATSLNLTSKDLKKHISRMKYALQKMDKDKLFGDA